MRKTSLYAIATALTVMTAATPLSVNAGEGNFYVNKLQKDGCTVIVGIVGNCIPEINIPGGNIPQLPETEAPDVEIPDLPEAGSPSVPEEEKPGAPGEDNSEESVQESLAHQVVRLVNEERAKAGLPALAIDVNTEAAALVRAKEIKQSFSHTRPNGTQFATALKEQGVNYRGAGENIAWGQRTPKAVMQAWMNSDGHRANILNPKFTKIGVGHYQDANGTNYWTQLFIF
ncbi:MAG: hypothetical protein J6C12_04450 [Lachnospiraceae bacterium]|nr:hypothetical protein [Lachnospiraceae bacterium]